MGVEGDSLDADNTEDADSIFQSVIICVICDDSNILIIHY